MISFGQNPRIKDFKITILSTMLSDFHTGEWGFSAMIEADELTPPRFVSLLTETQFQVSYSSLLNLPHQLLLFICTSIALYFSLL